MYFEFAVTSIQTTIDSLLKKDLFSAYLFHGNELGTVQEGVAYFIEKLTGTTHPEEYPKKGIFCIKPDKQEIVKDQIEPVLNQLRFGPSLGQSRALIWIDQADRLNQSSTNLLLKPMEEPPKGVTFILSTQHYKKLLPTILSRTIPVMCPNKGVAMIPEHYISYKAFLSQPIYSRFLHMNEWSKQEKSNVVVVLELWLNDMKQDWVDTPTAIDYAAASDAILATIKALQFNVNIKLQLESLALRLGSVCKQ